MNKYRNKKTVVDNITFDSKKEAARYQELRLLERAKEIHNLELQPAFAVVVNNVKVCTYKADFKYWVDGVNGRYIVEDVKGIKTPVYQLKKKLVKAIHGIEIQEI